MRHFSGVRHSAVHSVTKYLVVKLLKTRKSTIDIIKSTIVELELEATNNSNTIEAISLLIVIRLELCN